MPESALLVPVPDAEEAVDRWRQVHDPSTRDGVPAHITIVYPFVPPEDLTDDVIDELTTLFGNVDTFEFTMTRADRFPGVMYLAPEPSEPFLDLTRLVTARWPEYPPYGGAIAFSELVPHLTVTDGAPLEAMESVSEAVAAHLPIQTKAAEVWLLTRFTTRWNLKAKFALS